MYFYWCAHGPCLIKRHQQQCKYILTHDRSVRVTKKKTEGHTIDASDFLKKRTHDRSVRVTKKKQKATRLMRAIFLKREQNENKYR